MMMIITIIIAVVMKVICTLSSLEQSAVELRCTVCHDHRHHHHHFTFVCCMSWLVIRVQQCLMGGHCIFHVSAHWTVCHLWSALQCIENLHLEASNCALLQDIVAGKDPLLRYLSSSFGKTYVRYFGHRREKPPTPLFATLTYAHPPPSPSLSYSFT